MSTISPAWAAAISGWVAWAVASGSPATTLYTRRQHLQHLARHLGVSDPWTVTGPELLCWAAAQDWMPETRRGRRSTYRVFFGWGVEQGHVVESPALVLPKVAASRPNPRPAPDAVVDETLRGAPAREALMVTLAADHGLRRAEIAQVHSRDLLADLEGWTLLVHGKGGREREVPLTAAASTALRALPPGYAFPGQHDGHLSPRWVGRLVNRRMPGAWTIHKLRHRAGTRWHEESGDLLTVQELLGHEDPKTTRAYVKISSARLRQTVIRAAARPVEGAA